jgi:hypothetical protein
MSLAILDARQWQQTVDLRTGRPVPGLGQRADMVRGVIARHPFPGDRDPRGNAWVSETALDFIEAYDPGFVFLTYARQYYSARYTRLGPGERAAMVEAAFAEADRFARESGYLTVIIGTCGMTEAVASVDLTGLDGLAVAANWSARYAGVYDPSPRDLDFLAGHKDLERVASRQEILTLFGGSPEDGARLPDYMVVAKRGRYFNTTSLRRLIMIPDAAGTMPVSANLGPVASITDIKAALLARLGTSKVAVIYLESVGCEDFQQPFTACQNGLDWYTYEPGGAHYLTLTTGRHAVFICNGGYRYYQDDNETREYPFSGYFMALPTGTIGQDYPGRSIAVGNRSMFMHVATGCDITCECFARNLYNQGIMSVIHRDDK